MIDDGCDVTFVTTHKGFHLKIGRMSHKAQIALAVLLLANFEIQGDDVLLVKDHLGKSCLATLSSGSNDDKVIALHPTN